MDAPAAAASGRLKLLRGDAMSSLRFAAGMTMIGGVFVMVQAMLFVEGLWTTALSVMRGQGMARPGASL